MFGIVAPIFLLSAGSLLFQIALTRVFSVAQGYHFAFMIVSLALLGFGVSGTVLSLFARLREMTLKRMLAIASFCFSLTAVGSYLIINNLPFDSFLIGLDPLQYLYLAVYYGALAIPFLFTGLAVASALSQMPQKAGPLYGASLMGSGIGALGAVPVLSVFGGGESILIAALLGLVAVAVCSVLSWKTAGSIFGDGILNSISLLGGFVLVMALFLSPGNFLEVRTNAHKVLSQVLLYPGTKTLWRQWNSFSRVDLVESDAIHIAPGLSFTFPHSLPAQAGITTDGENLSPLTLQSPQEAVLTDYLPSSLVHKLAPKARVLIIEPKGGIDILAALHQGASQVVAVESNPLIVQVIGKELPEYDDSLYNNSKVSVVQQGARSYLRSTDEPFDVIVLSLNENSTVVTAGAYSLTENYLLTKEAFQEYYRHLAPGGFLSVSRWLQLPPSEEVRVLSLAVSALEAEVETNPGSQVAAIRTLQTATIVIKKGSLTPKDVETIRQFTQRLQFDLVYYPGITAQEVNRFDVLPREEYYEAFLRILSSQDRDAFYKSHPFNVTAPSDGKPYFFHFFKFQQMGQVLRTFGKVWQPFGGAGLLILLVLLGLAILFSLLLILAPLLSHRSRSRDSLSGKWVAFWVFLYFSALGLAFLFVEIPLLQRFILFLDNPTFAFAVLLAAILVFSGIGSLATSRLRSTNFLLFLLGGLVLIYPQLLTKGFELLLGYPIGVRFTLAVVMAAPVSFLMGAPFPLGIRLLNSLAPNLIPWSWAVNGCASVIAAVLAMLLALSFGFSWVMLIAGLTYWVALGSIYMLRRITTAHGNNVEP